MTDVDIFVIGGGINGCGIARDAAGRGYSVMLAEMNDLASGTSSASTKLIHGGLRYLEQYEFHLVREALGEREVLWAMAPHIISPLRFVLPHHRGLRPAWILRLGLFLYDHLGGRRLLPATRAIDLRRDAAGKALRSEYRRAFEYSDGWVQDARLVVLTAQDAAERGAAIRTRTKVTSLVRVGDHWSLTLLDRVSGRESNVSARIVVNAAGPWVDDVLRHATGLAGVHNVRLVQGSHIVVRKMFDHDRAYIFQNADRRIVFAIPFERDFTLIGTTDRDYDGDPADARITDGEIDYLIGSVNEYFARPISPDDVVWSYSGVRPLYDDGTAKAQETTRDYVLKFDGEADGPFLLNVFGGKITTFRHLSEHAVALIGGKIGARGAAWTTRSHLPGGDFPADGFEALLARHRTAYPGLSADLIARLTRAYGTRVPAILAGAEIEADLGRSFGAGLSEAEVRYLVGEEWARTADDILWRRSRLGLVIDPADVAALEDFVTGLVQHRSRAG